MNNKNMDREKDIKSNHSDDDIPTSNRRVRTVMSAYQSRVLYDCFFKNPFPSTELREELSRTLKMKPRTIQIWFQNQRQKSKNRKDYFSHWQNENRDMPYRNLNILATAAVAQLYERQREIEKTRKASK